MFADDKRAGLTCNKRDIQAETHHRPRSQETLIYKLSSFSVVIQESGSRASGLDEALARNPAGIVWLNKLGVLSKLFAYHV
jgi:hypothetical protein